MRKLLLLAVPAVMAFAPVAAEAVSYYCVLPVTASHAGAGSHATPTVCVPGP